MLEVLDYVIMPEHLHFLLVVHRDIVSKSGKPTHLGHVIAGFKYGCNKRYWAMTGKPAPPNANKNLATESPGTVLAPQLLGDSVWPAAVLGNSIVANSVLGDSVTPSFSPTYGRLRHRPPAAVNALVLPVPKPH